MDGIMNPLCNQVWSLRDLVDEQVENSFLNEQLYEALPISNCFDIRKIILTGAGDSYVAAIAMKQVFEKYVDAMLGVDAPDLMSFNRYTTAADIGIGEPNSPLVVGISAGGSTSRVVETLAKANELGGYSLALTNNADSVVAQEATVKVVTNTPSIDKDFPGLRSYFANLITLAAIASRLGHVRGVIGPEDSQIWKDTIKDHVYKVFEDLEAIDQVMNDLAKEWKSFTRFDFIGDGPALASAMFGQYKLYECVGEVAYSDDSEDWCHINYFVKNPETVGTVVYAYSDQPSFSRLQETIWSALQIGRPVLVITDDKTLIDPRATIIELPEPPAEFTWLRPIVDFIPVSLLVGYISDHGSKRYFNSYNLDTYEVEPHDNMVGQDKMTIANSKIDYYL